MKKAIVVLLACLAAGTAAYAQESEGGLVGNGGDGVRIGSNVHLLDFVEKGIEGHPFIASTGLDPAHVEQIRNLIAVRLAPIMADATLVARKLAEIREKDAVLAYFLTWGIRQLDWASVAFDPMEVDDEETVLEIPRGRLVQLAIRRERVIRINRHWLRSLSPESLAGLVFHEVAYASLPYVYTERHLPGWERCSHRRRTRDIEECQRRLTVNVWRQQSPRARDFVGFLFENDVRNTDLGGLQARIPFSLPHLDWQESMQAGLAWVDARFAQAWSVPGRIFDIVNPGPRWGFVHDLIADRLNFSSLCSPRQSLRYWNIPLQTVAFLNEHHLPQLVFTSNTMDVRSVTIETRALDLPEEECVAELRRMRDEFFARGPPDAL